MAETAGPFDGVPWSQGEWYDFAPSWAPSGVLSSIASSPSAGALALAVNGLNISIGVGRAMVRGTGFELTDTPKSFTVAPNTNASLSRRDRMVLRRDLNNKTCTPVRLTGTPASTPVAPGLTQNEAGIWDVPLFSFLVPPNSGTALSGIVDERVFVDPGGTADAWALWTPTLVSANGGTLNFGAGAIVSAKYSLRMNRTQIRYEVSINFDAAGLNGGLGPIQLVLPAGTVNAANVPRGVGTAFLGVYNVGDYGGETRPALGNNRVDILMPKLGANFDPTLAPFKNADVAAGQGQGIPQVSGQPIRDGSTLVLSGEHDITGSPLWS